MSKLFLFTLLATVFLTAQCQDKTKISYPQAPKGAVTEVVQGKSITDSYRPLEEMTSPATLAWVAKQDSLLKANLHSLPQREAIKNRIDELNSFTLHSVPIKKGGKYFYLKTPADKSKPSLYVQSTLAGSPTVLIDADKEFASGNEQIHAVGGGASIFPSQDGKRVAYGVSNGSSRWYKIRIRDIESGKDLPDQLDALHNLGGGMDWTGTNDGLYYVRFDLPDPNNLLKAQATNPAVYFHQVGTPQSQDKMIFKKKESGNWLYQLTVSDDHQFLVIDVRDGSNVENFIYVMNLQAPTEVKQLFVNQNANFTYLGNSQNDLFFYTNLDAQRGKVIGLNLAENKWQNIIPEAEETISGGSLVGGNALGFHGNNFVITYIKDGIPLVKGFSRSGKQLYTADFPIDGSIWGGFSGANQDTEVFYRFLGFTDPSTIYRFDAATGKSTLFKNAEVNFKSGNYITRQVFYTNEEGRKVPMFITHKKDLKRDGSNPAFMYAYGAFSWVPLLWYQEHLLIWLEMGGVYAQPSIRGGGEYGEEWHQAGIRNNRQNAVDDYLYAAQWLIDNKYTTAKKLVANGGSLSSPLGATAFLQRPDLFGALIVDRPALDMVRYTKFTQGSSWTNELGDPEKAEDFDELVKQSPYHQIKPGTCYPPILVMAGDKDQVTPPAHAYKFVAALQANASCNQPVLLKMMWGAGHTFGSTPEQTVDSRTDQIMFLVKYLGLNYSK